MNEVSGDYDGLGDAVADNAYAPPGRHDDAGIGLMAAAFLGVLASATVIVLIVAISWPKGVTP